MLAPIILFVYNRPKHTSATLQALAANDLANESVIYIYADGAKVNATAIDLKKIEDTRQVIRNCHGFKKVHIIESVSNNGLANSVINGVTQIVNQYGKVIVLEDDLITAKGFLKYMNDSLVKYGDAEQVMQISGHQFPVEKWERNNEAFFLPFTTSWGWSTWQRAWDKLDVMATGYEKLKTDIELKQKFDLDGTYPYSEMIINQMEKKNIDSWAIRLWWSVFKNNGIVLFPDKSLVDNIGFDNEGTHTNSANPFAILDFDTNYFIVNFPDKLDVNKAFFEKVKYTISSLLYNKKPNVSNSRIYDFIRKVKKNILKSI